MRFLGIQYNANNFERLLLRDLSKILSARGLGDLRFHLKYFNSLFWNYPSSFGVSLLEYLQVETTGRACFKACEAARNSILPQLRDAQGAEGE